MQGNIPSTDVICGQFYRIFQKANFRQMALLGLNLGRAVAQAVSRWLPTAAARVHIRASMWGFVVDKEGLGQVFSEYFGLPCQSLHQFIRHHNHQGLAQ
jgi:hypothetical protein